MFKKKKKDTALLLFWLSSRLLWTPSWCAACPEQLRELCPHWLRLSEVWPARKLWKPSRESLHRYSSGWVAEFKQQNIAFHRRCRKRLLYNVLNGALFESQCHFLSFPSRVQFYLDAIEVVRPLQSLPADEFSPRGDRYDGLRACVGQSTCLQLHKLRVFMVRYHSLFWAETFSTEHPLLNESHAVSLCQVGCGAIGCEMLKNLALLGVGLSKSSGEVFLPLFDNIILVKPCFYLKLCTWRAFSGVHHRSRPHWKVQPQSTVSLQTPSHSGKHVFPRWVSFYFSGANISRP